MLAEMATRFPAARVVLTLGADGALFQHGGLCLTQPGLPVEAIDTTGAGDTFTGYFVAAEANGEGIEACLRVACEAAAVSVTRAGAASSIPTRAEVREFFAR